MDDVEDRGIWGVVVIADSAEVEVGGRVADTMMDMVDGMVLELVLDLASGLVTTDTDPVLVLALDSVFKRKGKS
jgi:hypothetical protein